MSSFGGLAESLQPKWLMFRASIFPKDGSRGESLKKSLGHKKHKKTQREESSLCLFVFFVANPSPTIFGWSPASLAERCGPDSGLRL